MGRSKCHDNTAYSDSLNKSIASTFPIKKKKSIMIDTFVWPTKKD